MSPLADAFHFLINTLFTLYSYVLLVRVLLPAVGADYYNPFSQFIVKLTRPIIAPLEKFFPRTSHIDTAAIFMLWLVVTLKNLIVFGLLFQTSISWLGLALLTFPEIIELIIQFYFFAILIQVIVSWLQPTTYNPFITILFQLTAPLLNTARRFIPAVGGYDLSPIAILILFQLINLLIVNPMSLFAMRFSVGIP